jgi:polyisoprenoid-binding protein YceI
MKKLKLFTAAIAALIILNSNAFAQEAKKYDIEPNHTSVTWTADHFGFSHVTGKFTEVEGSILFDEKHPEKSSVDVTIKINSLSTGLPKFDKHLKSKDFFNADEFETATFVSKKLL